MILVYLQFHNLYVPNLRANLLSISELSEEYLLSVLFKHEGGYTFNQEMEFICNNLPRHGIYYVDTNCQSLCADENHVASSAQRDGDVQLWHQELGHVPEDVLKNFGVLRKTWRLRDPTSRKDETKGFQRQKPIC